MAGGCISTLLGCRGTYEKCKYWVRDDDAKDLTEYVYENKPSGTFYAKRITAQDYKKLVINNAFMFDDSLVTLYSKGQINLKESDIVEFKGELWRVQDCQSKQIDKNTQFMSRPDYVSYIRIKR